MSVAPLLASSLVCGALLLCTCRAEADTGCGRGARPWVAIRVAPTFGDPTLHETISAQLRAGLSRRGIDVCARAAPRAAAPIASVELLGMSSDEIRVSVTVFDAVTDKHVSRNVDLSRLPRDAWALALAVAAEEVLRASWAEIALESARVPKERVPAAVERTVRDSLSEELVNQAARSPPTASAGTAVVADWYAGGQAQLGIEARGSFWLTPRLSVLASVGLRRAVPADAPNGTIRASALSGSAGAAFTLTDPRAWAAVDGNARIELTRVEFDASPRAGAAASSQSATALYVKAGPSVFIPLGSALRFSAEMLGGIPLRSARAGDAGEPVTGLSGPAFMLGLGLAGVL
jgi:hypothetical protein